MIQKYGLDFRTMVLTLNKYRECHPHLHSTERWIRVGEIYQHFLHLFSSPNRTQLRQKYSSVLFILESFQSETLIMYFFRYRGSIIHKGNHA